MTLGRTGRAVGLFIILLALLEAIYLLTDQSEAILIFSRTTAHLTAAVLAFLGETVKVDGVSLYSPLLNMRIVAECTAITPTMVFVAAILAFPSPLSAKFKGILVGFVTLYLINIVRVVSLYYIGTHYPTHMEFAHTVVWQVIMILIAIGLWSYWATKHNVSNHR